MELVSPLRQLISDVDSSNYSESDLINRLEDVKKQLQCYSSPSISPEASALGVCYVTCQILEFLLLHRTASVNWHRRVFLLETAVTSAFTSIRCVEDAQSGLQQNEVCTIYWKLLCKLSQSKPTTSVTILTKLGVLLVLCWFSYDRNGKLTTIEKLLSRCSEVCLAHPSTQHLVFWPQFLRGMIKMIEEKNCTEALQCFQIVMENCSDSADDRGTFWYCYAIVLIHNGLFDDAVTVLDKCIRINYEPIACLSLQALVNVQGQDFYAAQEQLRRALEIDYTHTSSLFNYALVMERMGNAKTQQQLLLCILDHCSDTNSEEKKPSQSGTLNTLFDKVRLSFFFPSRLETVDFAIVHYHMALATMETGDWFASKNHFEYVLGPHQLLESQEAVLQAARDYIYVLLQCNLPSLALGKCEQFLRDHDDNDTVNLKAPSTSIALLLLHFYKADALLCLERVEDCYQYLKDVIEPKSLDLKLHQKTATPHPDAIVEEIAACHAQLLNNLAIALTCCADIDASLSLLRKGLDQYPDSLAIKFNLVLLLWRKGDKTSACSIWTKARGWTRDGTSDDKTKTWAGGLHGALSARQRQFPCISRHVQDNIKGEGGVSASQLLTLDALIANYQQKMVHSQQLEASFVHDIEFLESLGS